METALKARASPALCRSGKEKLFSIMFQIKLRCTTWQLHEELTSGVTSASGSQSNLYLFPFCSNFWHTGGLSILMNFFFECFTAFAISWNFKKTACYTPQWKESHLQSTLLGALCFFTTTALTARPRPVPHKNFTRCCVPNTTLVGADGSIPQNEWIKIKNELCYIGKIQRALQAKWKQALLAATPLSCWPTGGLVRGDKIWALLIW